MKTIEYLTEVTPEDRDFIKEMLYKFHKEHPTASGPAILMEIDIPNLFTGLYAKYGPWRYANFGHGPVATAARDAWDELTQEGLIDPRAGYPEDMYPMMRGKYKRKFGHKFTPADDADPYWYTYLKRK